MVQCLGYFAHLSKHGSINARPVYLFMLALTAPSRPAFEKAIDACKEAKFINLQAIALERYTVYLRTQSDTQLANDCITTAYWLYQDWGAHAKTLELQQTHDFLKVTLLFLPVRTLLYHHIFKSHMIFVCAANAEC